MTKTDKTITPADVWSSLLEMARDDGVDPAKMQALVAAQESVLDRMGRDAHAHAKASAILEMPKVRKDRKIVHPSKSGGPDKVVGTYKDYDDLRRIIDPILAKHGLILTHDYGESEGMKMLTCTPILAYSNGKVAWTERGGAMPLPLDTTGSKSGPQSAASSGTYGKRHTTCAMLSIRFDAYEDDDASAKKLIEAPTDGEQEQIDWAEMAAKGGMNAYKVHFKKQSQAIRKYLVDSGTHDRCKRVAAAVDEAAEADERTG